MKISRKLIISNVVFSSGGMLVTQLINLFVLPLFIRNIGAELYGLWVISSLLLGYLDSFDFGLSAGLQRYVADAYVKKDHREFNRTVSTGLGMLFLIGVVFGSAIILAQDVMLDLFNVSDEHRITAGKMLVLTGIASMVVWPLRSGDNILRATLYIKTASIIGAIKGVIISVSMLFMVMLVPNVVWILGVSLALRLAFGFISMGISHRYHSCLRIHPVHFSLGKLKEMSGFSLNIFCFSLMGMLSNRIHPVFISAILSPAHVVYYTVMTKVWQLITRYTSLLNQTILPTAFNLSAASDTRRIEMLVERGVRYRTFLAAPLAMVCLVASPVFINLWMGLDYVEYAVWSQLLSVVILITPLAIAQHVARGCGKPGPINILFAFRMVLNVAVTVFLLPRIGAGATVLGIVASQVFLGEISFFVFYCRLCGIKASGIFLDYLKINAAILPFGLLGLWATSVLSLESWIMFLCFCGVFVVIQYLTLFLLFFTETERNDIWLAIESIGLNKIIPVKRRQSK